MSIWKIDWSAPKAVLVVSLVGLLCRLPLALSGIGFDGDSSLYLVNALLSREEGRYIPSRGPGYFLPDMLAQWLGMYGPHWLCLLNTFFFTLSVPAFATILRLIEAPHRSWLIWTYTLFPVSLVASSDVMVEYSLFIFGILLGWLLTLRGNFWAAGFAIGCGAAMRPSQGLFILAVFLLYWFVLGGMKRLPITVVSAIVPLVLLWIVPVGTLSGWSTLVSYLPYEAGLLQGMLRAAGRVLSAVGLPGFAMLAVSFFLSAYNFWKKRAGFPHFWFSVLIILLIAFLFFRHPFKMNYLFVSIPFVLYAISAVPKAFLTKLTCALIIVHNFIGLPSVGRISTRHQTRSIGWGTTVRDYIERRNLPFEVEQIVERLPENSALGAQGSTIRLLVYDTLRGKRPGWRVGTKNLGTRYVYDTTKQKFLFEVVKPEIAENIRQSFSDYNLFITSGAALLLKRDYNYDAGQRGYMILQVPNVGL